MAGSTGERAMMESLIGPSSARAPTASLTYFGPRAWQNASLAAPEGRFQPSGRVTRRRR